MSRFVNVIWINAAVIELKSVDCKIVLVIICDILGGVDIDLKT